jgi:hypothetical protein
VRTILALLSGREVALRPVDGEKSVLVPGVTCLGCDQPLRVCGVAMTHTTSLDHRTRTYEAKAIEACHTEAQSEVRHVGTLRTVDDDTFFGFDEDDAVLRGRPRVYGP